MPKPTRALIATAYHEAGHAVMAWAHDVGVKEVSIVPNMERNSLGHCQHIVWSAFRPDLEDSLRTRDRVQWLIMVFLGGREAERRFTGRYNHGGATGDMHQVFNMASYLASSDDEIDALVRWLTIRTRNSLDVYWAFVEGLAAALLEEQQMRGKRVREVMTAVAQQRVRHEAPPVGSAFATAEDLREFFQER